MPLGACKDLRAYPRCMHYDGTNTPCRCIADVPDVRCCISLIPSPIQLRIIGFVPGPLQLSGRHQISRYQSSLLVSFPWRSPAAASAVANRG